MLQPITSAPGNYGYLYETMQINAERVKQVKDEANIIYGHMARYQAFVKSYFPLMPWYYLGILHMMEGSCNFNTHLANGDPLTARTVRVPKNTPTKGNPPFTWEQAALYILTYFMYDKKQSWTNEEMLARWERWNGMAYQRKGLCSPYLWSGSNHYIKGKYVADGKFDPNAVSKQIGAALLLKSILDRLMFEKQAIS